jgi:16S rRNA (uracil1498-N3)-methyltransferase
VNLLLIEPHELDAGGLVRLTGVRARHLAEVLKATVGQPLRVGVIDGPVGSGELLGISTHDATLRCTLGEVPPPRPPVDLLLALPRPKVLRRLWPQLSALGVGRIILTNAERVERNYFDTHLLQPDVYRPLLVDGLEQARDTRLPPVTIHRRFRVLVEDELTTLSDAGLRVVADPRAASPIAAAVRHASPARVLLAVGPEGGWNRFELDLLGACGFTPAGMGSRTLRTDTACIALLALVHDALRAPGVPQPGPV